MKGQKGSKVTKPNVSERLLGILWNATGFLWNHGSVRGPCIHGDSSFGDSLERKEESVNWALMYFALPGTVLG